MGISEEVPAGWTTVSLGELGRWGSGGTPKRSTPEFYGGNIPWLVIGDLNDSYVRNAKNQITELGLKNSSAKVVPIDTLLVAMYGSIGKLGISAIECATNQAIAWCKVDNDVADLKYLFYLMMGRRDHLLSQGKGGAQQNISQTVLKSYLVSLAPRTEQTLIANKLDELLAQVNTIRARVDAVPGILKRFRQSVLAAAVSGKLTEEWRLQNDIAFEKSWESRSLESLVMEDRPITYGVLKPGEYVEDGILLLRIKDILEDSIEVSKPHKVSVELSEQYKRTILSGNETLISLVGTIGRIGFVPAALCGANLHRNLGLIAPSNEIDPQFLYIQMKADQIQKQIRAAQTGANQPLLNLGDIRKFTIELPQFREQEEIVKRVEQLFALADQIKQRVHDTQSRVDNLTQSILAKAFRGELVPQDPDDEPASVLLERIKAAKEGQ